LVSEKTSLSGGHLVNTANTLIWWVGAIVAACGTTGVVLSVALWGSRQMWRAYKEAHGWVMIRRAMREYHERHEAEEEGRAI
jgi:hypothetical protein